MTLSEGDVPTPPETAEAASATAPVTAPPITGFDEAAPMAAVGVNAYFNKSLSTDRKVA